MNEIRIKRFENLIRDKISFLIMNENIKDPRVNSSITLTRVKATRDLASARIWVSSFGGDEATQVAIAGLSSASGFIQSVLGKELRLRNTPKLFFTADHSIREGLKVNRLIHKITQNTKADLS